MYLIGITFGLVIAYFFLGFLFSQLFQSKFTKFNTNYIFSAVAIFWLSIAGYFLVELIPDPEMANRVLHAYGGGFLATLVCFLSIKDTNLKLNKLQFSVISILTVTTLGVGNEIVEYFLQNYAGFSFFSTTPNETWHDLISNLVGTLIGVLSLVWFVPRVKA